MNAALSTSHSDMAFYRNRKAMLIYPLIVLPFLAVLFWLFKGGKGERYTAEELAATKAGSSGFNANVPTAKSGSIDGRSVESPGYGKAQAGQVLSRFSHTHRDSTTKGLNTFAVSNTTQNTGAAPHVSSLAVNSSAVNSTGPERVSNAAVNRRSTDVALPAHRSPRVRASKAYYYNAPGSTATRPYYTATATDQQLDRQLQQYETSRNLPSSSVRNQPPASFASAETSAPQQTATVRLSDNLTASRLSEPSEAESPFLTAPTGGSRPEPTRAVLDGNSGYGQKKAIAWMIPVVVHEDQTIKDGQQVKLRLLKEITADGVTIPVNTVLYAMCQLSNDRLRLTVQNLQLHGQLIPLDLDVYDTDGSPGVNVPGLGQSSQINGNLRTSAIQGAQLPGLGGLANTVLSSARMGATQSMRQTTIRLRSGYNLFLKAQ